MSGLHTTINKIIRITWLHTASSLLAYRTCIQANSVFRLISTLKFKYLRINLSHLNKRNLITRELAKYQIVTSKAIEKANLKYQKFKKE